MTFFSGTTKFYESLGTSQSCSSSGCYCLENSLLLRHSCWKKCPVSGDQRGKQMVPAVRQFNKPQMATEDCCCKSLSNSVPLE